MVTCSLGFQLLRISPIRLNKNGEVANNAISPIIELSLLLNKAKGHAATKSTSDDIKVTYGHQLAAPAENPQ